MNRHRWFATLVLGLFGGGREVSAGLVKFVQPFLGVGRAQRGTGRSDQTALPVGSPVSMISALWV